MSQENVEIVRALFDAFARRDHEAAFDYYDAEIEWDASRAGEGAGIAGVYHGHELAFGLIGEAGCGHGMDVEATEVEFVDAGQTVVALINQQRLRGRGSGIEVNAPPYVAELHTPEWKGRAVGPICIRRRHRPSKPLGCRSRPGLIRPSSSDAGDSDADADVATSGPPSLLARGGEIRVELSCERG